MLRIDKTVFISYRRTNAPWVLAISQNLTHHGYDVFFDYTGLASGDFETAILDNIHSRAHFLVLLTPSALERCGDPGDWLRREIEAALDNKRNVIPLMLEGFDFGTPSISNQLTGKLASLRKFNAMTLSAEHFDAAMEKLRNKFLNVALETVVQPASLVASQAATDEKSAVAKAPAVAEEELTAQQWFERGFNSKDLDEQLRSFSEAIRLEPGFAEDFYARGLTRSKKGDLDGAFADYNQAICLKPDFAEAFCDRGIAREDTGDLCGALADYDQAIHLKPDYPDAFCKRGNARSRKGDLDDALADYDEAIRLKPDLAEALYNRGITRYEQGDLDGALTDYEEAIRLKPDHGDLYFSRGEAREAKGDLEGALQDYNEAIRLQPDDADAFYNRGLARQASGDLEGALHDYGEAIRLKPDYAEAFNNRGALRYGKGDLDGALADYTEAIRLEPDYADAIEDRDLVLQAIADRSRT
ncbi:MAG: tetratricopeptide repeat protein [Candidatus Korobacteraceae bacterium]